MWLLDGSLVNLCTFPGILVHQFFYLMACKLYKLECAFSILNFTQFLSPDLVTIGESDRTRFGEKLERWATLGSALACGLAGAINEFTPKGSLAEGVIVWVAISIGVQSFPLRNSPGGKIMKFIWIDALYGLLLYSFGKVPLLALATWFPSLGLGAARVY